MAAILSHPQCVNWYRISQESDNFEDGKLALFQNTVYTLVMCDSAYVSNRYMEVSMKTRHVHLWMQGLVLKVVRLPNPTWFGLWTTWIHWLVIHFQILIHKETGT